MKSSKTKITHGGNVRFCRPSVKSRVNQGSLTPLDSNLVKYDPPRSSGDMVGACSVNAGLDTRCGEFLKKLKVDKVS